MFHNNCCRDTEKQLSFDREFVLFVFEWYINVKGIFLGRKIPTWLLTSKPFQLFIPFSTRKITKKKFLLKGKKLSILETLVISSFQSQIWDSNNSQNFKGETVRRGDSGLYFRELNGDCRKQPRHVSFYGIFGGRGWIVGNEYWVGETKLRLPFSAPISINICQNY